MARDFNPADHVILYRRNRALVDGRTSRVRLKPFQLLSRLCGSAVCLFLGQGLLVTEFPNGFFGGMDKFGLGPRLVGLFLLVVGVGLAAATVYDFRKRAHLSRHGRLLTGVVTKVAEDTIYFPYGGSTPQVTILYRYLTPAGDEKAGRVQEARSHGQVLPGDQLAILYASGIAEVM